MPTQTSILAIRRNRARQDIESCDRCDRRKECRSPIPFTGPAPSRFMMVVDTPNETEDRFGGMSITGENGHLNQIMLDVGLPPVAQWFRTHAVPCYSPEPLNAWHLSLCARNLRSQIEVADPDYIVLFGNEAMKTIGFIKDKLTTIHGKLIRIPIGPYIDRWVMPTFHPGSIYKDPHKRNQITDDLATLARIAAGEVDSHPHQLRIGAGGKTHKISL